MSTLMPHLAGGRHHIYRGAIGLALVTALIAAAFGMLSVALILAAIALPAVVLTYMHDHDVLRGEPISVLGLALLASLALGVGVGMLEHHLTKPVLLAAPRHRMPTMAQILELGILVPTVTFVAVLIPLVLVTARSAFRHSVYAVVICSLSGAAFSLGLSVVIQRGAFTHLGANAGDPAHVAFIALTLGFCSRSSSLPPPRWRWRRCAGSASIPSRDWPTVWRCWCFTAWPPSCWPPMAPVASC
ncbi:hypothetical protein [Mycobacterium shottsii]|uniref:hypothetical protein n=1 Tax=Mycobacterium shottsii TaxID=133549 RepID=UPI00217EB233|nr:hypothetical protein [Mycobacterium shottsii]